MPPKGRNKRRKLGLTSQNKTANLQASQEDRLLNGASHGRLTTWNLVPAMQSPPGQGTPQSLQNSMSFSYSTPRLLSRPYFKLLKQKIRNPPVGWVTGRSALVWPERLKENTPPTIGNLMALSADTRRVSAPPENLFQIRRREPLAPRRQFPFDSFS